MADDSEAEALPVGVVVPVLNAREELPGHLKGMREWLDRVAQVVVVDSHSEDGSLEYLKAELDHPRAVFLSHPPGLYPSWNHGIAALETDYFFVSTLGDRLAPAGLERLYETAVRFDADVVVSPPRLVDGEGHPKGKDWPLHRYVADRGLDGPAVIDGWDWLACGLVDLPGTLIGSSASNLYRTAFMQARPFSEDYGRMGDSAWALRYAFEARFAVDPRVDSSFWIHEAPEGIERQYARLARPFAELAEMMTGSAEDAPASVRRVVEGFREVREDLVRYYELAARYRELRRTGGLGARLGALRIKRERSRIRRRLRAFRREARDVLANG